ncbi:MAG: type VI secretion system baseplate subunit TssG [Burkholderiales bacterium]|nr:type VI secretion system baseplate subunit TssG [Burkholderiales bacterium]
MGTDERPPAGTLIDRLASRPHGFNLFQAISLLERAAPDALPVGEGHGQTEAVRLGAVVSLGFQPSDVATVSIGSPTGEPFSLTSPVLSLAGAHGPLPIPFTELLLERKAGKDRATADFLDIFNHRLLAFLYRSRKKHHMGLNWGTQQTSSLAACLDALSALGLAAGSKGPHGESGWLRHAGLMGGAPRSLTGLVALLADRLGHKVRGSQFRGGWQPLAASEHTQLGVSCSRLGRSAVLGRRAWYQCAGIEIEFRDLSLPRLKRLLPGGREHALTKWLIGRYVQQELQVDLVLRPVQRDIRRSVLGHAGSMRLGWTSWLAGGTDGQAPHAPVRLRMNTVAAAG